MSAVALLSERLERWTGIALERLGRREAIAELLRERARTVGTASAEAYVRALSGPDDREVLALVALVRPGRGWFFRDPRELAAVERLLRRAPKRRLRIWMAGCGTGEEAWALAMLARAMGRPAEVLATDHSGPALDQARAGRYQARVLRAFPAALRGSLAVTADNRLQVVGPVRDEVTFEQRSLVDVPPAPGSGGWELILCRGPLSFFRPARAVRTLQRLSAALEPQGALVLGERELPARAVAGFGAGGAPWLTTLGSQRSGGERNVIAPRRQRLTLARALRAGSERLRDGDPQEALLLFDEAIGRAPLCAEAHLLAGMACHRLGDPAAAVPSLRNALFLAPALWPAAYSLALSCEELGEPGAARQAWEQVLHSGSRSARATPFRSLLADLESWKPDVLELARRRTRGAARRPVALDEASLAF